MGRTAGAETSRARARLLEIEIHSAWCVCDIHGQRCVGANCVAAYAQAQTQLSAKDAVTYALAHRPEVQAAADRGRRRSNYGRSRTNSESENLSAVGGFARIELRLRQQSETYAYASETLETSGGAADGWPWRRGGEERADCRAQVRSQIALKCGRRMRRCRRRN